VIHSPRDAALPHTSVFSPSCLDEVEYATLEWVDWFTHRRLLEPIGYVPPAEFETAFQREEGPSHPARLKHPSLR
jgi:hypothetical protein